MSDPKNQKERCQMALTERAAGPAENVVSTACPSCHTRFAMLAKFYLDGWHLRCTVCGIKREGELK